jgi:hypothetical protein
MTVRKTVLGVTSRKRDFAIVFILPAARIVRMIPLLGTVPIDVNQHAGWERPTSPLPTAAPVTT